MPESNSGVNNTSSLRAWFRTCPTLVAARYFGADYLGPEPTEYAIISVPSTLKYRENIVGKRVLKNVQEQNFIFAAKVPYGSDVQQNLDNLAFFQDVQTWVYQQNLVGNFPDWDSGVVTAISVTSTGSPVQIGTDAARYQFQVKVTYKIIDE